MDFDDERHIDSGVYFIACAGFVKIGRAWTVKGRFTALRVGNPLPMTPLGFIYEPDDRVATMTEQRIHERLAAFRHRGEWFSDTPEVRRVIADLAGPWPQTRRKGRRPLYRAKSL